MANLTYTEELALKRASYTGADVWEKLTGGADTLYYPSEKYRRAKYTSQELGCTVSVLNVDGETFYILDSWQETDKRKNHFMPAHEFATRRLTGDLVQWQQ